MEIARPVIPAGDVTGRVDPESVKTASSRFSVVSNTIAYIGLGANLGNSVENVREAIQRISRLDDVVVLGRSSLYRTSPVGYEEQSDFINAVISIETGIQPRRLLTCLQEIEVEMGRVRIDGERNRPREIDCDLLMYGTTEMIDPDLQLPHPRMTERLFVLVPLRELDPDINLPGEVSIDHLCQLCRDSGQQAERIEKN